MSQRHLPRHRRQRMSTERKVGALFGGFFLVALAANLAFWGFILWLAYTLVMHFTG